ncbi:DHA2 family efflux MFS transporter permease subunit [Alicyclobacillus acidoterrestris]
MDMDNRAPSTVRTGPIFAIILIGAFVAFLNQTLINVALPQMMDRLHITATTGDWLTTIYMLVNGIVIPVTAFLMDRFTTRQLYITAMSLFTAGTLICFIAPNFGCILVGRVVQAAGAGILFPLITNIIFTLFPPEKRGGAMGLFGISINFAPAVGPTLSGWLVENHSWRILFLVILPIALIDLIISIFVLKNVSETSRPKLDVLGVILSTIGFGGILYGFSTAGDSGWGSIDVISMFVIGVVALILFVWRQWVVGHALLEFRIFRYPMFTLTTVINVLVTMALYSGMILMPIYMQDVRGFSSLLSGLMLLPGGIVMGIMSPITGRLYDKMGARWLAVVGLAVTLVTTFALSRLHTDTSFTYVVVVYTVRMFGMSILMMPIFTAGLNELALTLNRYGTAMVNTLRMIAGAVGMALFVSIMTNSGAAHTKLLVAARHIAPTDHVHMTQAVNEGTVVGINEAFMVATIVTCVAFVLSFFIQRTSPKEDTITTRIQPNKSKTA